MDKIYYLAILEPDNVGGYGVFFPDLPGCVSGGDNLMQAANNAEAALHLHIAGMLEDGLQLPSPRNPCDVPVDGDVVEAARLLIAVAAESVKVRVNIMIDSQLLAAIDAQTNNRSRFLAAAAREKLLQNNG